MGLLSKLTSRFKKRKDVFPQSKHIVEYAFTCGGVDYYQFQDIFNIPYQRGLQAIIYYREMSINVTKEILEQHVEAVRNCLTASLSNRTIDINKAYLLNEQLRQRLSLPPDTDLLYKLASVVFFDQNERPESYEFGYGDKKIKHWKENSEVLDFFLQQPIQDLIPFLKDHAENIVTYQEMIKKHSNQHLDTVLGSLSEEQRKQFKAK